ncbi:hypothetical protein G7085_11590 [Tessaracoccus sp. HDW20]|nr:hypothetical protein [Tessaracoccus coleopterorum]
MTCQRCGRPICHQCMIPGSVGFQCPSASPAGCGRPGNTSCPTAAPGAATRDSPR